MKFSKTPSVEELQLVGRFEGLRTILLGESYREHLTRPLAYWALPTDRRLPLALLGRTLDDLLRTPFVELSATPGIGQKKIRAFVKLLGRVANTDPAQLPVETVVLPETVTSVPENVSSNGFDPATVSELVWSQWRTSVARHGLAHEPLGRFAPSLKQMTRVVWNRPLSDYLDCTLADIRGMKTHGEKRVRAVLEVFHCLHALVSGMGTQEHLLVRIVPRRIDAVQTWAEETLQKAGVPEQGEVMRCFICPLLEQVRMDAVRQIVCLAESRLGIHGPITSVRQAARNLGLTRARVYQLLNEINDILHVRWPMGRHLVYELRDKFARDSAERELPPGLEQFHAAIELFYPGSRRGADGPLERDFDEPPHRPRHANGRARAPRPHTIVEAG